MHRRRRRTWGLLPLIVVFGALALMAAGFWLTTPEHVPAARPNIGSTFYVCGDAYCF